MFKKSLVFTVVALSFSTTLHASSVHEEYKGYPVVNLSINEQAITSEVPPINFDGNTLVPIRVVAENLGATVKWDSDSNTVRITSSTTEKSESKPAYKELTSFLNKIEKTAGDTKTIYNQLIILKDIYLLDHKAQETDVDFDRLYKFKLPNQVAKSLDYLTEFDQLKKSYSEPTVGFNTELQNKLENFYTAQKNIKVAADEFQQYKIKQDDYNLRNFLVYMYRGYTGTTEMEAFIRDFKSLEEQE